MTLGGISFGGLASGLDTNAIIEALLAVESRSIFQLQDRKTKENSKLTLIGTFEGLVNKLRDQARDLQLGNNFFSHKLSVGEEGVANFTLSGTATTGSHTLKVMQLASASRHAFAGVPDADTTGLGAGNVSFTYEGVAYDVAIASGTDTLNQIAAAINGTDADVTASVVNSGTESTPSYQLVLAGNKTGADFAITGLGSSILGVSEELTEATNAQAVVDGLTVERSTNVFSDVITGVSFNVSRIALEEMTFTVDLDPEGMRENIKGFVDAFNEVARFIDKQNDFSTETGAGGPLFGDTILSGITTALRRTLFGGGLGAGLPADFKALGLVGIDLQSDGTLKIDQAKLDESLSGDLDSFSDFFRAGDDITTSTLDERGVFVRIEDALDGILKSFDAPNGNSYEGLIGARRTAVNRQIKDFDSSIERLEARLEKLRETLVAKFAALEQIVGGLQSQQAFLNANAFQSSSRR